MTSHHLVEISLTAYGKMHFQIQTYGLKYKWGYVLMYTILNIISNSLLVPFKDYNYRSPLSVHYTE